MIRVGLIGVGFMGWIHYLAYQRSNQAKLTAFVSRDEAKRSGDWRGIKGNFGPPGQQIDLNDLSAYQDTAELLADPLIDVVDICLPPHLHADTAVAALEAGKHVFCEKPLALTIAESDRIMSAAKQSNRLVMVAQVLPYIGPYQYAYQAAQDRRFGSPMGGYFKRIISNPDWIPDFFDPDRVGGPLVDLHVHDAHFIRLLFGMPDEVYSRGPLKGQVAKFCHTLFGFPDRSIFVSSSSGVIDQQGRPFTHGFELYFEKATLQFEFGAIADDAETMPLKVLLEDGSVLRPTLPGGDDVTAFELEIADMVASIHSGVISPALDGQMASDAVKIALCEQRSIVEGRAVRL